MTHKTRTYMILNEMHRILENTVGLDRWHYYELDKMMSEMKKDVETTEAVKFNQFGELC